MRVPIPEGLSWSRRRLGLGAFGLLAAACGAGCRRSVVPAPSVDLAIALPAVPHTGLLHIAAARGFFSAQGLAVTLLTKPHGKAALAELLAGRADLAAAADVPVVIEMLKGAPLSIAATVSSASNELAVLARRDRGIGKPADLQGRRVGVTLGTSADYFLWAFMVRNRLAPQSLALVDLPPGGLIGALRSGQVDAITAWQPVRHEAELFFGDAVAGFGAAGAYAQSFVLAGRDDFLHSHPEVLQRLLSALIEAEHFARTEPERVKGLLAERFGLGAATLEPALRELDLEVEQQQAQLVTLEDVADWAMARGYAPRQSVPNFLPRFYLDPLLAVEPARVTVAR